MYVQELFNQPLFEDLGNLKQLNAGKLLAAFMGTRYVEVTNARKQELNPEIGPDSEIIDAGNFSKWEDLRKKLESYDSAAFALYQNGKIFMLASAFNKAPYSTNKTRIAYFGPGKEIKRLVDDDASDDEIKKVQQRLQKVKALQTEEMSMIGIKRIFDEHRKNGDISVKIVLRDASRDKKVENRKNRKNTGEEVFAGANALKERLAKYKLSKNPSAKDLEEFLKLVFSKKNAAIRYNGLDYTPDKDGGYDNYAVNGNHLLDGRRINIIYAAVNPRTGGATQYGVDRDKNYNRVKIEMELDFETMSLVPISIKHTSRENQADKTHDEIKLKQEK